MKVHCTNVCRIFFLVFIIFIAGYFVYLNEQKKNKESFANTNDDILQYNDTIRSVFQDKLKRLPQEFEYERYKSVMTGPYDAASVRLLQMNPDEYQYILEKNILDSNNNASGKDKLSNYRLIVDTYENVLNRLPTIPELDYYTARLTQDNAFTITDLEKVLQSSREFQILTKNQTNKVNSELPGRITSAQVKLEVEELYAAIYGTDKLSKELEDYLITKYVAYNLDKSKFNNYLQMLYNYDNSTLGQNTISQNTISQNLISQSIVIPDANITRMTRNARNNARDDEGYEVTSEEANANANANACKPCNANAFASKASNASTGSSGSCSIWTGYSKQKYTDPFYEDLKKNSCMYFSQDALANELEKIGRTQNMLAEYQYQRNMEEMKMACYKVSADMSDTLESFTAADMPFNKTAIMKYSDGIRPVADKTNLPITILDDLDKTRVGSIMPTFLYSQDKLMSNTQAS